MPACCRRDGRRRERTAWREKRHGDRRGREQRRQLARREASREKQRPSSQQGRARRPWRGAGPGCAQGGRRYGGNIREMKRAVEKAEARRQDLFFSSVTTRLGEEDKKQRAAE
uniref:Uncharacterized protein n=1 Tax=Zea mays TaxID=4577 RepID=A0A804NT00_MAIZE